MRQASTDCLNDTMRCIDLRLQTSACTTHSFKRLGVVTVTLILMLPQLTLRRAFPASNSTSQFSRKTKIVFCKLQQMATETACESACLVSIGSSYCTDRTSTCLQYRSLSSKRSHDKHSTEHRKAHPMCDACHVILIGKAL